MYALSKNKKQKGRFEFTFNFVALCCQVPLKKSADLFLNITVSSACFQEYL